MFPASGDLKLLQLDNVLLCFKKYYVFTNKNSKKKFFGVIITR